MRFACGGTRWVILTDLYAIKIARFRPIRLVIRFLQLLLKGEVRENLQKHDENLTKAVLKYVGAGILANRTESRLYKHYGRTNDLLIPTLFTICWLVNVQLRGKIPKEEDILRHRLWNVLVGDSFVEVAAELRRPNQFCIIGSRVYLADYGMELLEPVFAEYQNTF